MLGLNFRQLFATVTIITLLFLANDSTASAQADQSESRNGSRFNIIPNHLREKLKTDGPILRFVTPRLNNNGVEDNSRTGQNENNNYYANDGGLRLERPAVPQYNPALDRKYSAPPRLNLDDLKQDAIPLSNYSSQSVLQFEKPSKDEKLLELFVKCDELEKQRRWPEALELYDAAIRAQSNDPELKDRYRKARYHLDVPKRYRDRSYLDLLSRLSLEDSFDLLYEIVYKIQGEHVEFVSWDDMFRYGINDLSVALKDPSFLEKNQLGTLKPTETDALVRKIEQTASRWIIRHHTDYKNGILKIAEIAKVDANVPPSSVVMEFACGAASSLDTISSFLTLNQLNDTSATIEGNFVGIGVSLDSDEESLYVIRVFPNSPAETAGIRNGDRILVVDGKATKGLGTDIAADFLQGAIGTKTSLVVSDGNGDNAPRSVDVTRRVVHFSSVEDCRMLNPLIGYVKLSCFQVKTKDELESAMWQLHNQGMRSLVLDLRGNPGGLLPVAADTANLFLDEGLILRTRRRGGKLDTPYIATKTGTWKVPLIVLIDEDSASASEIFAGAMRDHDRAVIIGHRSYGKGTVQAIHKIYGGRTRTAPVAGLRLTVEQFYSPKGLPYNGIGVEPDIIPETLHTVARPIDGNLSGSIQPKLVNKSSNDDPCIKTAIETATKILTAERNESNENR